MTRLVQMDLGSGFAHIEPVGGPFSAVEDGHVYEYRVIGQGSTLQVVA